MKPSRTLHHLCGAWSLVVVALFAAGKTDIASAFTASDRDLCWSYWTNAFYYTTADGRAHFRNQEGNTSPMSFWQEAEEIEVVEDATGYPGQINMVNALCSGFTNQFGTDWSWNTFNDDLMWASMAFSRAYLLTGNTTYRTLAKNGFDLGYSRGWDPVNGGIFQNTANTNPKCTCGNGPGAVAAYMLYQSIGDASYAAKAQAIYNWMVMNVFDPATGAVMEGPGTGNYFTYDSGTFATIAYWLGDTNNAFKAGDWVTNHWGIAMQSFGPGSDGGGMNGICVRGLARTGHNIPFLQAVCENAWSWRNARGLTATDWHVRTSDTVGLYSYDTCSGVAGMLCVPPGVPPTLPVTAADVVGSQMNFTAAFGGANLSYQWQVIRSGATNNLPRATNATLTLSNLQLTNTALYRLQASNSLGVAFSLPSSLTVSSVPAPVNNVIISYAAQTGLGYGFALTPAWTVPSGSLIFGQPPSGTNGDFNLEPYWGNRDVGSLTAGGSLTITPGGSPTTTSTNYVTCGNGTGDNGSGSYVAAGSSLIYTLTNASPAGCNLTNITVYGGWRDAGRDQQAYTVYYSKVASPATFILLGTVNYNPANVASVASATRATLIPASGPLATNVAAVKFDFTSPGSENGYCGYSTIALYGTPLTPVLTTNTLPVTAADVVGSQVTFAAAFNSAAPMMYQWQVISGGTTNNVSGATNATLTLTNLQLTNTASYQLRASNSFGVAFSNPSSLTVNSLPSPVNNVLTTYAAQTGPGSNPTNFIPTWTAKSGSLIAGQSPSSVGGGNFGLYGCGTVSVLTDGTFGWFNYWPDVGGSSTEVTCGTAAGGAGQSVTYTLGNSPAGYTLTNLVVYGGWGDAGRDQQAYTVYYSTISALTTFISLSSVNYNPSNPSALQSATRATLTPVSGALATNVAAVKFDFTTPTPENAYCGYSEIQVFGVPTLQPVKWAVGNSNWDTTTANWKSLSGGSATAYVEGSLAAFDDTATGTNPITVTLTGNRSPSVLTNNSAKTYILAGNYSLSGSNLVKDGTGTLVLDNGAANAFSSVLLRNGTLQIGNNDTGGSLGAASLTNNGVLLFNRSDTLLVSNTIAGSGSVVQSGSGILRLSVVNPYSGNTTINAGTLALTGPGSISASALIAIAAGATLDATGRSDQTLTLNGGQTLKGSGTMNGSLLAQPSSHLNPGDLIGALTVQGSVNLQGSLLMAVNRTNSPTADQLAAAPGTLTGGGALTLTNLGPALQPGDTFRLFNQPVAGFTNISLPLLAPGSAWVNNLSHNGSLAVVSTLSPSLASQTAPDQQLRLAWLSDHTGWRLQVQTNSHTQGLGTNWSDVPGSAYTNQLSFPLNSADGGVFYRLTWP